MLNSPFPAYSSNRPPFLSRMIISISCYFSLLDVHFPLHPDAWFIEHVSCSHTNLMMMMVSARRQVHWLLHHLGMR